MTERTTRFALPFIMPGQAQKEIFHNEALALVDGLLHPVVLGFAAAPPAGVEAGECWIVASGAAGAWEGRTDSLALGTAGGWRFVAPTTGMSVWDQMAGLTRRWTGSAWNGGSLDGSALIIAGKQIVGPRLAPVPSPSGGTIIDAEARAAVDKIIVTLKSHGLID